MNAFFDHYFAYGWVVVTVFGILVGGWAGCNLARRWKLLVVWLLFVTVLGGIAFEYRPSNRVSQTEK